MKFLRVCRKVMRDEIVNLAKSQTMKYLPVLLLLSCTITAQNPHPKNYFQKPLDIPLQLSGNFGELRSNHFHAGFDFRTQQKEGLNVYAAAEGHVSRFKISPYGYGKAVYIDHPNGYTTVYAHLQKFAPEIEAYLKNKQYELQSFDVDIPVPAGALPVKGGQLIALSGNTGGSNGPHLHFEIRDTKTEKVINPMFFGYDVLLPDSKKPHLNSLLVYPVDPTAAVNKALTPIVLDVRQESPGVYIAETVYANGRIGFGINAADKDDHSHSENGLHAVSATFNGMPTYAYTFDTFHFDETRYINALIDYPRFRQTSQRVQRLFRKKPFDLSIIRTDLNGGVITVTPNLSGTYRIVMEDYFGNKIEVNIPVVYAAPPAFVAPTSSGFPVDASRENIYEKNGVSVTFPAGTFYEDFHLNFDVRNNQLFLDNRHVAVHSNFTVSIPEPSGYQGRNQTFIALLDGNRKTYLQTSFRNGFYIAKAKALGQFALERDTVNPTIKPVKNIAGKWISADRDLRFTIRDDLSGIKTIDGWLNGKWILFEYDYKNRRIVHDFSDGKHVEGRNDLKIEVTDNVGNSAIFETHFFRATP